MKHEAIDRGDKIAHDKELEVSFGRHVPQPSTVKGHINVFGELAGSTDSAMSLVPKRDICFDDSIDENRHNQPKSR